MGRNYRRLPRVWRRTAYGGKQSGFEAGVEDGGKVGILEGNVLGWEKGSSIGSEVGFYAGFAESLLLEMDKEDKKKPRVVRVLSRMTTLANEYPLTEPTNPDLLTKLEELRVKFKQVCSVLGIKPETPNAIEAKGISF